MTRPKSIPALVPLLILVFAAFIGILIYTWVESDKANPQMLDEKGRVKASRRSGEPVAQASTCAHRLKPAPGTS